MTYDLIQWPNLYIPNHLRCKLVLGDLPYSEIQCHQQFEVLSVTLLLDLPDRSSPMLTLKYMNHNWSNYKHVHVVISLGSLAGAKVTQSGWTISPLLRVNSIASGSGARTNGSENPIGNPSRAFASQNGLNISRQSILIPNVDGTLWRNSPSLKSWRHPFAIISSWVSFSV